jgi:plasmid stabilization system protein ParE
MPSYILSSEALDDLAEIETYIAVRMSNPSGALTVSDYLFEAFHEIGLDPEHCGGRRRPDILSGPLKFLNVRKYVVAYDDRKRPVSIIAIMGARRNLRKLLASDHRFSSDDLD